MMRPQCLTGDEKAIDEFMDKFDTFLFDCDGVVWSGDHTFAGVAETIGELKKRGKQLVFVTNNSTKSRADYKKKFAAIGIDVSEDEIFGSSYSAAIYISRILKLPPPHNKVFAIGESGLQAELAAENLTNIGASDPSFRRDMEAQDFAGIADESLLDPDVAVVLVGLDYHFNYLKLAHGLAYLRRKDVKFLATNLDATLPSSGSLFPGAGSVCAPLRKASGREPLALGKPSQTMMEAVESKFKFERGRACMVGDRLDTDIQFGIDGGLGGTLLVLTGVTSKEMLEREEEVLPSHYIDGLGSLNT